MSDTSSLADAHEHLQPGKRSSDQAGLGTSGQRPNKSVKRRASKACQCCRARKVRCNVVEQIPCTNCRLDEVECIVSESKRKKKWSRAGEEDSIQPLHLDPAGQDPGPREQSVPASVRAMSQAPGVMNKAAEHIPHALYQDLNHTMLQDSHRRHTFSNVIQTPQGRIDMASLHNISNNAFAIPAPSSPPTPPSQLPRFIKPLPGRIGADDIQYLSKKGALTIPPLPLRNALLRCFVEFVYPYMPLLDIRDLLDSIDRSDGRNPVSLLMFQAVMFSGVATVSMKYLRAAGYQTRRDARRDFFQKTRLLYDFDYEVDRISLIQSLLLMTYWYETPDDQKDSHHWMGIAVSLSHTIGLHRNPERSNMDGKRQRLWKRIWWSTFMRDRLIALGMRRPTRIKNEDFDVPMLTLEDFEISVLPTGTSCMPSSCVFLRDVTMQREMAIMCIEKAKLCVCISHVLSAQYSVLHNNHGVQSKEGSTRTTMMLVARKDDPEECGVRDCDEELRRWKASIAPEAEYVDPSKQPILPGHQCMVLNRSLLHMVYFATLSALHRPQVLPSTAWPAQNTAAELLEISRANVRHAATEITSLAETLSKLNLVRYLPTVGITVLLPAIIIHLLDIKAPDEATRRASLQGFCQCMQIMSKLRDIYAAADYSTAFLEAAIRKAEIALPAKAAEVKEDALAGTPPTILRDDALATKPDALLIPHQQQDFSHLTPPPDHVAPGGRKVEEDDLARRLNTFLASTPPESDGQAEVHEHAFHHEQHHHHHHHLGGGMLDADTFDMADFEPDFDALVNLDAAGEAFALDDAGDMGWMRGLGGKDDDAILI